jgi:hypothetical protein
MVEKETSICSWTEIWLNSSWTISTGSSTVMILVSGVAILFRGD